MALPEPEPSVPWAVFFHRMAGVVSVWGLLFSTGLSGLGLVLVEGEIQTESTSPNPFQIKIVLPGGRAGAGLREASTGRLQRLTLVTDDPRHR